MSDSDTIDEASKKLRLAVGECVLAWSSVELALADIFMSVQQTTPAIPYAVLGSVRSFNARLKMIGEAFNVRYPFVDEAPRDDWRLLYNYINSSNDLRNQVAHALEIMVNDEPVLEPYFVMTAPKPYISTKEVHARTERFRELDYVLRWWLPTRMRRSRGRPEGFLQPAPDLVLRLRDEAARTRAKPKRPRRSSRA